MSWKGHVFTEADAPRALRRRGGDDLQAWLDKQTARYEIISIDDGAPEGKKEIIAEELQQRILNTLSPKAKRIAGSLVAVDPEVCQEVLGIFGVDGKLKNPFRTPD
jgi:hypothetical protein